MFAAPDHKDVIVCKISVNIEDMALAELSRIASEDKDYQKVADIVLSRKYEGKLLRTLNKQHPAHQYSAQWDGMSVHGIFLTFHGRMIVPEAARRKVLTNLHLQHTGKSKTLADARQLYFWPGMTDAIGLIIAVCKECTSALPSQPLEREYQPRPQDRLNELVSISGTKRGTTT